MEFLKLTKNYFLNQISLSRIHWRDWLLLLCSNTFFTLVVVVALFWAQSAHALPWTNAPTAASSTSVWPYQGRLANNAGTPITAAVPMTFRLYNVSSGGSALWQEAWASVQITGGLFNVMLGSQTPIPQNIINNTSLWLGISVGADSEMTPRVQLGSVPFVSSLPDGSIGMAKIADGAVTASKQTITTYYFEDNSFFVSTGKPNILVSSFSLTNVPAGDITVSCSFVAFIPSGKSSFGTVMLKGSTGEIYNMPSHVMSANWDQYILQGIFRNFSGGNFNLEIRVSGEFDDFEIHFGSSPGVSDQRFGRHCMITAGQ